MTDSAIGTSSDRQYRVWYLGGHFGWMTSWGMIHVLFPYLVTIELGESPERVGFASSMLLVSSLLFSLFGGTTADKYDIRRLLIRLQCLAGVAALALAIVTGFGALTYWLLIAFAVVVGTIDPFVIPARNALLNRMATDIQPAVAKANRVQFIAKFAGAVLGGMASFIGASGAIVIMSALKIGSGLAAIPLRPAPKVEEAPSDESQLARLVDGLLVVRRSREIFPVIITQVFVGIAGGTMGVISAILIRDEFLGSALMFAIFGMVHTFGRDVASQALVQVGHIDRPGRLLVAAMCLTIVTNLLVLIPAPAWFFGGLTFAGGINSGFMQAMARSIVHHSAPPTHLARALSVFELGYLGSLGLSALAGGFIVGALGPREAVIPVAVAASAIVVFLLLRTTLWRQVHKEAIAG